jgi:hypothetical protein
MNNIIKLISVYLLLSITACSKKDNDIPPCNNCGSTNNTSAYVSATINGWQFYTSSTPWCQILLNQIPNLRTMVMVAESNNHRIYLSAIDLNAYTELLDTAVYSVSGTTSLAYFDYSFISNTDTIFECLNIDGFLKINFQDTVQNKISGIFQYTVFDQNHNDTFKVTNGVFNNIKYEVIN